MSQAVSQTLANAVDLPKHNGNGDNRFAILIEGSKGIKANPDEPFQQQQFEANIREMAKILTEHENNIKPGPGYTGYYLQDQISYVGIHDDYPISTCDYPYLERDKSITKSNIYWAIQEVARKCDSYDKVLFFYTGYGGTQSFGGKTDYFFDADNNNLITPIDLTPDENRLISRPSRKVYGLDNYLDMIECKDMTIILQPDFSGDWIDELKRDKITSTTYRYETNRVILTSDKVGVTRTNGKEYDFDLCNKEISDSNEHDIYYVGWDSSQGTQFPDNHDPKIDYEEYSNQPPQNKWQYKVKKYNNNFYEVDIDGGTFDAEFYENWGDNGVEFVSGLTEAQYIDRFTQSTVQSNDILDADESTTNALNGYSHFPSISGNSNEYISCKEGYDFMKLWHLGYRLNKNTANDPWYDEPKIEYTYLEVGNNYLF